MWNNFLQPVAKDWEILKVKKILKIEYNPARPHCTILLQGNQQCKNTIN